MTSTIVLLDITTEKVVYSWLVFSIIGFQFCLFFLPVPSFSLADSPIFVNC